MSQTAYYLDHLAVYGLPADAYASLPLPADELCRHALGEIFGIVQELFSQTALEPDAEKLLWEMVNVFHRLMNQAEHILDSNMQKQRALQEEQDGSEVRSVALEEAIALGYFLKDRRDTFEQLRIHAEGHFEAKTGRAWLPQTGSKVNRKTITAAMLDSRDFINAQREQKNTVFIPKGTKIVVAGGKTDDHQRIWAFLDTVRGRHPDMVLLHGGADGVEKIAALWAENRRVTHIVFRPDWNTHKKAAPFKRNDALLQQMPAKVFVLCPDSGIHEQLIRESKRLGLACKVYGKED